jgi:hypothetical protein
MIELPSGKKAGITNIRARYHATRRNLKIDEETPLTTLLQLVDIVESLPKGSSAAFHNEFVFSGHTLADFPHFQNWDEQDLELFHDWLENPSQYRQVEKARHRVVMDDLPIKVHEYDYPGLLYSCLHQRIEQLPLARASAMQWLGTLHNMQQDGLRPDELRWSGLERWLGNLEPHRMVTKDELLDGVDFSAIRLDITNELVGGGSCGLVFEEAR